MSRDYLFPDVDPKVNEHQQVMRTDSRRQTTLGPQLERLEEVMEEVSRMYLDLRGVEQEDDASAEKSRVQRRKNAMCPVMDHN